MKTRHQDPAKSAPRGLRTLAFLGGSLILALGGLLAVASSGGETPPRAMAISDPLTDAKVAIAEGDFASAENLLRKILKDQPGDLSAKVFLGRVLRQRGRLSEARDIFGAILKADPKNCEATRGLGSVYQAERQFQLAVVYFSRAAQLKRDDPQIFRELAFAQEAAGDSMGALSSLQESLKLDPGQSDLMTLQGELALGGARNPLEGLPDLPKMPGVDRINPRPIDPASLIPRPKVPDPRDFLPKPDGRVR